MTEDRVPMPAPPSLEESVEMVQDPANPGQVQIRVPIGALKNKKLFLAVPMYGGQSTGMFTRSVLDLSAICAMHGIGLQVYFLFNESLITRARNYCVDEFMRSDCSHLMFIDSDIGFDPRDVLTLMAFANESSDYDVIGGAYPKKCIAWEKIVMAVNKGVADQDPNVLEKYVGDYVFNPKNGAGQIPLNQPVEVMELGTGFMMIRRKTLEAYAKFYPELFYKPDHVRTEHFDGTRKIQAAFDVVVDRGYTFGEVHRLLKELASLDREKHDVQSVINRAKELLKKEETASFRYLSEDYMFCQNVIRMGAKVWLCPWMKLQHVGSMVFGGSLPDLASIGASATADVSAIKKKK